MSAICANAISKTSSPKPAWCWAAKHSTCISPYNSVYKATKLFGGPVRFICAGSGHIAGVINPPALNKYNHWLNDNLPATAAEWIEGATDHKGSWWPDWEQWLSEKSGEMVPARKPGSGKLKVLEDAPGSYVLVKSED